MPEPVTAPVAFLSGDYSPDDSVNSARLSARFLAHQGKPWDLMAWSFSRKTADAPAGKTGPTFQKSAVQLQREAAIVLALGGGFQAYFKQKRDGSIFDEQMPAMAEVAQFCRARQHLSHRAVTVPQIAVLFSVEDTYRRVNSLFGRSLARVNGVLQALVETQNSVDVLGEHQLTGRLAEYPLIVVPECDYLTPTFRDQLAAYAKAGGNLLLVGPTSAKLFERELGVALAADTKGNVPLRLSHAGTDADLSARAQLATLAPGVREFGRLTPTKNPGGSAQPAASISSHGRGKIAAVYFSAGQAYAKDKPAALRQFLHALARELFPEPMVEARGAEVDVTVARNHGKLLVHLVNTSDPHATAGLLSAIPPTGPLSVSIRHPRKPTSVALAPSGQALAHTYRNGKIELTVPAVAVHEIVVITP